MNVGDQFGRYVVKESLSGQRAIVKWQLRTRQRALGDTR